MNLTEIDENARLAFSDFVKKNNLNETQAHQFLTYLNLLRFHNEVVNLTTITDPKSIINRHFQDSLALVKHISSSASSLVDVGSGGGFPGIPLKIALPHLKVTLIEVTEKKISFLQEVIHTLGLRDIEVYPHDWRTFLRKTTISVEYVVARASLELKELLRMFKPSSPYKTATLIYWASRHWIPTEDEERYIDFKVQYVLQGRSYFLVFFANKHLK